MFVDRVRVHLRGGNGGAGVVAFERRRGLPKGRPTGGNGGRGGNVIVRVDEGMASLLTYQRNPHHRAGDGTHGRGDLQHGRAGEDLVLPVPAGTTIYDEEGTLIADLVAEGQSIVLVEGGRGGRGNAAFMSPTNRAPSIAEQGEFGREETFVFELRLLADAALIGYQRRKVDAHLGRVGGQAQDRRLPVHDPRPTSESSRWTAGSSSSPTSPA